MRRYSRNGSKNRVTGALVAALCAMLALPALADRGDGAKGGRTRVGDTPWDPARLVEDASKVIYGSDDRLDVYEETDLDRLAWAASTCALVTDGQLTQNVDGTLELTTFAYRISGLEPCAGEPFAGQPVVAFCTGFMVGTDLIATAGHCLDGGFVEGTRFVFGFRMLDAVTPVTTFDASQVYTGVEVVGRRLGGVFDYAVVRVDRPIVAPGAEILELRRVGTASVGTPLGLIGHPAGLPLKISFGEDTLLRNDLTEGFFLANVDSYGGNSGSPVLNAETGLVEGILVTGETDFVEEASCFRSNVLDNRDGNEGVSKAATFADFVPTGKGQIDLGQSRFRCEDTLFIQLYDANAGEEGFVEVTVTSSSGDVESLVLFEEPGQDTFSGGIFVQASPSVPGSGALEVSEGDVIEVVYEDGDDGSGGSVRVSAAAVVDCTPPVISSVSVDLVGGRSATVFFETDERSVGAVRAGTACDALGDESQDMPALSHAIRVGGLEPTTQYFLKVAATDMAGNVTPSDAQAPCFSFTTTEFMDYFTEGFFDLVSDFENLSLTLAPDASLGYKACLEEALDFPSDTACAKTLRLGDDDFARFALKEGKTVQLFGASYSEFFVGSNGYITFGQGDRTYVPSYETHFDLPRISGYFADLAPHWGGTVEIMQAGDRVAVTFRDVPDIDLDVHSFQIELFFDGAIRLTWLLSTRPYGIIGLSAGEGQPEDFEASDLSAYEACTGSPYGPAECETSIGCNGATLLSTGPATGRAGDWAVVGATLLALLFAGAYRARGTESSR